MLLEKNQPTFLPKPESAGYPPVGTEIDNYEITGDRIVKTNFSEVFPAVNLENGEQIALKIAHNVEKANIEHEAEVHQRFSGHQSFVTLAGHGTYLDHSSGNERPYIATRYQENKNLFREISDTETDEHSKTTEQLDSMIRTIDHNMEEAEFNDFDTPLFAEVLHALEKGVKTELMDVVELEEAVDIVVEEATNYGYDELATDSQMAMLTTRELLIAARDTVPKPAPDVETVSKRLKIISHAAGAVAVMHAQGFVHRDIKPGNVYIDKDYNGRLGDFGIAIYAGEDGLDLRERVIGSRGYMSVEAHRGKVHKPGDVYALAATAYEAVTDRKPYEIDETKHSDEDVSLMQQQPVMRPEQFNRDVSSYVGCVIMQGLSLDPSKRPDIAYMQRVFAMA